MTEIKFCPFCGGPPIENPSKCLIYCDNCLARSGRKDNYDRAIKAWNTRYISEQTVTEILLEGKLNEMTIAQFKPKYEKLLDFIYTIARQGKNFTHDALITRAQELLKEIGE